MNTTEDEFFGIRLKRGRAWDEINRLKGDIDAFLNQEPAPYTPVVNFNNQTHVLAVSVHVNTPPDPVWGVRIGEVVHNLRSAMDHVIRELYFVTNRQAPPPGSKNQFPIVYDKKGYTEMG